ncbi:tRNA (adenosine(37)-N6)-dimethylallyltransferase MiaA [Desulfitibacter alkalitolerans]|uniref:tRNA (adenosine(37)-N6)-dimethylallyltransferase MiaA n=1 Tax=Desulfitibacter alkalitolerans TaxID=264641 RepID=UPI0004893826|nr:tRNA (adenosine(37)-N6)-dimethylallyltransferase MiaA [Desulfitibacter alkalitolerans]
MGNKLIVIVGPTAVGKSKIGVELASQIKGEIVSGDSMQVYKGMDIGTAKIKEHEMFGTNNIKVKHHMIDIIPPQKDYSVADFQEDARNCINEINKSDKIPILLGGTGLYVRAVIDEYDFQVNVNHVTRLALLQIAQENGTFKLYKELKEIDADSAERIHPNDTKRIVRALEYFKTTGKPISSSMVAGYKYSLFSPLVMIGLNIPRTILYERINQRVDTMIQEGLIEEVENLLKAGVKPTNTSMQAIGYKQVVEYLSKKRSLKETIEIIKRDTRRFAKRQLTWFRRDDRIKWFEVDINNPLNIINEIKAEIGRNINI